MRYLLALALLGTRSKQQNLDQAALDIVKPLLLEYVGDDEDKAAQEATRTLLKAGDAAYIAMHNTPRAAEKSLYPVPYDAPFLIGHVPNMGIFAISTQQKLFRVVRELNLFNEQVTQVQQAHDRTFEGLSPENFKINAGNLAASTNKLAYRSQALIKAIAAVVDSTGRPVQGAR